MLALVLPLVIFAVSQVVASSGAVAAGGPLVFIHGIKGAKLADAAGNPVWITGAQALGLRTPELSLPLTWTDGTQGRDAISPQGVLTEVSVIPVLVRDRVYGPWMEAARKMDRPFHPFFYDWRRDNLETVAGFEKFLEFIRAKYPGQKIRVVAHSMGGLVTMAVLNRNPGWFEKVFFAGAPFRGGIGFLVDLHAGEPAGLNRKLLAPEVLFTFPSVYTLFQQGESRLVDENGAPVPMDFYRAKDWRSNRLGVFAESSTSSSDRDGERERFLETALEHGRRFRAMLKPRPGAKDYPPVVVISGKEHPTLSRAMRGGPKSVRGWDFETLPKESGDGRIRAADALPPDGIPYHVFFSRNEHSDLLNDPEVIARIRE